MLNNYIKFYLFIKTNKIIQILQNKKYHLDICIQTHSKLFRFGTEKYTSPNCNVSRLKYDSSFKIKLINL